MVNELIGLLTATAVGFLFGLVVCSLDDKYGLKNGLTNEIMSRCELHSIFVGILIAIPSGAAVAIAILGDNTGSLVGTAISASLLPPAVNAGLLWALSLICLVFETNTSIVKTSYFSQHQAVELAIFGCISMCVTLTNIISVFIIGVCVLKLKEVAPMKNHHTFWHHDIKIARDYNKTVFGKNAATDDLVAELASLKMHERVEGCHGIGAELFRAQSTWSPSGNRHGVHHERPHVRDLEALYLTLALNTNSTTARYLSRQHTIRSPMTYKSIPDENILSPAHSKRSQPIDTPHVPVTRQASSSYPQPSTYLRNQSKKRFVVTPSQEDPLKHRDNA